MLHRLIGLSAYVPPAATPTAPGYRRFTARRRLVANAALKRHHLAARDSRCGCSRSHQQTYCGMGRVHWPARSNRFRRGSLAGRRISGIDPLRRRPVTVKQGDLLFVIDPRPYVAAVKQADAAVRETQARENEVESGPRAGDAEQKESAAQLVLEQRRYRRGEQLLPSNTISKEELELSESDLVKARRRWNLATRTSFLRKPRLRRPVPRSARPKPPWKRPN